MDYVRSAIARNLGVPEHLITLWRVTIGVGSMRSSASSRAFPTQLEAELEVTLSLDREALARLDDRAINQPRNSLFIQRTSPQFSDGMGQGRIAVDITLCYGKETQHIFKALYQTMTVRGRQKAKNRRHK